MHLRLAQHATELRQLPSCMSFVTTTQLNIAIQFRPCSMATCRYYTLRFNKLTCSCFCRARACRAAVVMP